MTYSPLPLLEQQFGASTLWNWTKDWIESEKESDADEHMNLLAYLMFRATEDDNEGNA